MLDVSLCCYSTLVELTISTVDLIFSELLQPVRQVIALVLPLPSDAGCSVYLLTSNTESCDEDDEGVGVAEELRDCEWYIV